MVNNFRKHFSNFLNIHAQSCARPIKLNTSIGSFDVKLGMRTFDRSIKKE